MNIQPTSRGFSLVELMIAMTLGLAIMGGIIALFLSNKQAYRTQEALSRVQESGRLAFEIMARDIRMAGNLGCPRTGRVANVLKNQSTDWWADAFGPAIIGYDGDQNPLPRNLSNWVTGTDIITIRRAATDSFSVTNHNATSAQFKLNKSHTLKNDDIIIVCDTAQASLFQITNANASNVTIVHNEGTGDVGNCSKYLGHPDSCTANAKTEQVGKCPNGFTPCEYEYGADSTLALYEAIAYYIGTNASGNRSLYRIALTNALRSQELIEGIEDMQLTYGVDTTGDNQVDTYLDASDVTDWTKVVSVQINLLAYSTDNNVAGAQQSYTFKFDTNQPTTATDYRLRKGFSGTAFIRVPPA